MTRNLPLASLAFSLALVVAGCPVTRTTEDSGPVETPDAPLIVPDAFFPIDTATPTCPVGQINCGGTCTRVAIDNNNCGSCGNVCPAGVGCAIGVCDCFPPMIACAGRCLDPEVDRAACGSCDNACDATEMCSMGECIVACTAAGSEVCVNDGAQVCADLQNDPMNCGLCNVRCGAGAVCTGGRCGCPTGTTNCGGVCADLRTDAANCGACLTSCGTGGVCTASTCSTCGGGLVACGSPARCTDTSTSRLHCGACGTVCADGEGCTAGVCGCLPGRIRCGGVCVNPAADPNNCGGCGMSCGAGGVCNAGTCACAAPLELCGTTCHDTETSVAHCGDCATPCPPLVGGVCTAGTCGCPTGTTNCSGRCVDLLTDSRNCNACGMACAAGLACGAGTCAPPTRYIRTVPPAGVVPFVDACAAPGHMEILNVMTSGSARVLLPFAFRYWAANLPVGSMINVSTNGFINMDGVASAVTTATIPAAAAPNSLIAAHLGATTTRAPGVCVATVGGAPNRQWVVEWNDATVSASSTVHLTYEIILNEATGTIDLVYGTMTGATSRTAGIEDAAGANGLSGCPTGATCTPASNTAVRFVPAP